MKVALDQALAHWANDPTPVQHRALTVTALYLYSNVTGSNYLRFAWGCSSSTPKRCSALQEWCISRHRCPRRLHAQVHRKCIEWFMLPVLVPWLPRRVHWDEVFTALQDFDDWGAMLPIEDYEARAKHWTHTAIHVIKQIPWRLNKVSKHATALESFAEFFQTERPGLNQLTAPSDEGSFSCDARKDCGCGEADGTWGSPT